MQAFRPYLLTIQIVLVSTLLSACGSGSSSGSSSEVANTPAPVVQTAPEINGLSPTNLVFDLQEGEVGAATVAFANSGDAPLTFEWQTAAGWIDINSPHTGSLAPDTGSSLEVTVTCGAIDLVSTLSLTTNDSDEANLSVSVSATCTPAPRDLVISRLLLNQGARAFDSEMADTPSINIVEGRELLVRVFVTGTGVPPEARVVVQQPGQADATFTMQTPPSISQTAADESMLSASHYVVLPAGVVDENTMLQIQLAPFTNPIRYPASGSLDLDISALAPFRVTFVPVTFNGETPDLNSADYMRQALQVLPIGQMDVDIRTPYVFTGAYDLEDLLMEISDLRDLDGSDRLYHGIIVPPDGGSSQTAGVGFVGFPVSVSIDLGGAAYVIAHEMGHNLNLGHAPGCDAPGADVDYPYAEAAVTTWGYDVTQNRLVEPTATRRDFMSYCSDLWVSDYHFSRAVDHRQGSAIGFGPPVPEGLLISGRLAAQGLSRFSLMPIARYRSVQQVSEVDLPYRFVAWDVHGVEVVDQPFSRLTIEDVESSYAFSLRVPRPANTIHHFEIRRGDAVLVAEQIDAPVRSAVNELVTLTQGSNTLYRWAKQNHQALVIKNALGEVVAVDRSGEFTLSNSVTAPSTTLSATLAGWGHFGMPTHLISGTDQRVELAR